jgi:bifunctional DNA-binding transcriptional regulator/antitoxin component of YhaV-PrlF toxin-antitoxin module
MSKVSRKHQITTPVRVLRAAGIASGDDVIVRADDLVSRYAGSLPPGTYPAGYLEQLRDEWVR